MTNAIAGIWNAALVAVAALDLAYGSGKLAASILGSMFVTAVLAGMATSIAEAAAEALPFLTASVGTLATVFYWILKADYWLHSMGAK